MHGLCHLFGHDHHLRGPAKRMRKLKKLTKVDKTDVAAVRQMLPYGA